MTPLPDAAAILTDVAQAAATAAGRDRPVIISLCGAQGSGKSTAAALAADRLAAAGLPTAILSLDDLYLTRAERLRLAATVHPLLATRGVPGTHDVARGLDLFDRIARGDTVALPRFDKAIDDRAPPDDWPTTPAGLRVLLFEGWCVGARPQDDAALDHPVNALEAQEDADGRWRRWVNACLADTYQPLFARLDRLVLLRAPDFAVVRDWRMQQEQDLRRTLGGNGGMDDDRIDRFVQHYERLTRHILTEMPGRADRTIALDASRRILAI